MLHRGQRGRLLVDWLKSGVGNHERVALCVFRNWLADRRQELILLLGRVCRSACDIEVEIEILCIWLLGLHRRRWLLLLLLRRLLDWCLGLLRRGLLLCGLKRSGLHLGLRLSVV